MFTNIELFDFFFNFMVFDVQAWVNSWTNVLA